MLTPDEEMQRRLYYAALDVIQQARFHDAGGALIVIVPHRVWVRLEAVIDALPHPAARGEKDG